MANGCVATRLPLCCTHPPLLFLDEPTIGLDTVSKLAVRDFGNRRNRERGTTVILTTHDMEEGGLSVITHRLSQWRPPPKAALTAVMAVQRGGAARSIGYQLLRAAGAAHPIPHTPLP